MHNTREIRSKSSKPNPDFRFIHLYGPNQHLNLEKN